MALRSGPCCTLVQRSVAQLRTSVLLLLLEQVRCARPLQAGALRHLQWRLLCHRFLPHQTCPRQTPSVHNLDCVRW